APTSKAPACSWQSWQTQSSMAQISRARSCRTAQLTNSRCLLGRDVGPQQLETRRAFELADRQLAGAAELGLTGPAQKLCLERGAHIALNQLRAAAIDVKVPDRALARCGRGARAVPPLAAVTRLEKVGQRVGLLTVLRACLRVGDDAQTGKRPASVEQPRYDHRKIQHFGAGVLSKQRPGAVRPRPIFELVVITKINLAQAVRLGRALAVIGPARERPLRRATIAAAGVVDKVVVRQRCRRRSELQAPYIGTPGCILCVRGARAEDDGSSNGDERAHAIVRKGRGGPVSEPAWHFAVSPTRRRIATSRPRGFRARVQP